MPATTMSREQRKPSLTFVLFLWLTPQLISLALSATRVPLSAHPPQPIESVALQQMVIVQFVVAAMVGPVLFRCRTSKVAVVMTAFPMLQLAAFLSSAMWKMGVILGGSAGAFSMALGVLAGIGGERQKHLIWTLASGWTVGGLVLAYLHTEFAGPQNLPATLFGPAYVASSAAASSELSPTFWFFMGTFASLGLAGSYAARRRSRAAIAAESPTRI
jgi:hypothetical protein